MRCSQPGCLALGPRDEHGGSAARGKAEDASSAVRFDLGRRPLARGGVEDSGLRDGCRNSEPPVVRVQMRVECIVRPYPACLLRTARATRVREHPGDEGEALCTIAPDEDGDVADGVPREIAERCRGRLGIRVRLESRMGRECPDDRIISPAARGEARTLAHHGNAAPGVKQLDHS